MFSFSLYFILTCGASARDPKNVCVFEKGRRGHGDDRRVGRCTQKEGAGAGQRRHQTEGRGGKGAGAEKEKKG